jgi:hypothetical protein
VRIEFAESGSSHQLVDKVNESEMMPRIPRIDPTAALPPSPEACPQEAHPCTT